MKKFKITGQLVTLFTIVILMAIVIYTGLAIRSVGANSEDLTLAELTKLIKMCKNEWESGGKITIDYPDNIYCINGSATIDHTGEEGPGDVKFEYKFSNEEVISSIFKADYPLSEFMNSLNLHMGKTGQLAPNQNYYNLYISYACTSPKIDGEPLTTRRDTEKFNYVIFFATTDTGVTEIKTNLTIGMVVSFSCAFVISLIILLVWSRRHVYRIKKLQKHIQLLQTTDYKDSYCDDGNDEIAELSYAIEKMRIEILENEKTKQEMLQNISHDFKTPIGVIKSYAEAMEDGHMIDKGPEVIINQANILYNKTQQLIIYNKLEYLTKDKPYEDVNMKRLIENVVNNASVANPNICYNTILTPGVYFKGYADNYRIVIENIIDNANRYAKKNIKITLKSDYIEIYNDGEHIDEKFIQDGFKAYEKGSNGKFGLGMSIVVKTLDFFGYRLVVRNEEQGVTFRIEMNPDSVVVQENTTPVDKQE